MARPLRILYPGAWYHVMNRGAGDKNIFRNDSDRYGFLRLLEESVGMWNIEVHAYSLMETHYHILIRTPLANLPRAMRHIDGVHTQRFNLRHNTDGHLFRGRYKSILIDKEHYLLEVVRYIHLQKVRAGLIDDPKNDQWSSHQIYLSPHCQRSWLFIDTILGLFGTDINRSRRKLDNFVKKGVSEELEQFYGKQRLSPILGSETFINRIKETYVIPVELSYEIPDAKIMLQVPINHITQAVCLVYGISLTELKNSNRGRRNTARNMAVYLARKVGGYTLNEIASYFGCKNYSGVSSIIQRFEQYTIENTDVEELSLKAKKHIYQFLAEEAEGR